METVVSGAANKNQAHKFDFYGRLKQVLTAHKNEFMRFFKKKVQFSY